jgi:hypothetical protein
MSIDEPDGIITISVYVSPAHLLVWDRPGQEFAMLEE